MSQNCSTAVMQQRAEPRDSLDDFPTPPWAGRALCEYVLPAVMWPLKGRVVWEPACNRGFLARGLADYFGRVIATDVHDYGWVGHQGTEDFLFPGALSRDCDIVVTNPPFVLAHAFIERALNAGLPCAVLVRTSFLEGVNRFDSLFSRRPPLVVAQFAERVPMVKGRYDPHASTATSYCWLVWAGVTHASRMMWIPPCRKRLERLPDDAVWCQWVTQ